jgi:outer membrane protein TolC
MKIIHPHAINFKPLCIFFLIFIPFFSSSFTKLVGQNGSPEKNIGINPRAIVEIALRNNPELAIRKLDEKVGADSVKQAKGEFDPELFAEVSYGQRQMTQNERFLCIWW